MKRGRRERNGDGEEMCIQWSHIVNFFIFLNHVNKTPTRTQLIICENIDINRHLLYYIILLKLT